MNWICDECSKLSIKNLVLQLNLKLQKLDKIESDKTEVKQALIASHDKDVFTVCTGNEIVEAPSNPWHKPSYAQKVIETNPARNILGIRKNRRDSAFSVTSDRSKKWKRSVNEVAVLQGNKTNATFQGVQPKLKLPPRKHYFVSRVPVTVDTDSLLRYCNDQNLNPLACRELPSRNQQVKSLHIIFPDDKTELVECSDTWPENIILRRYFLNDEARAWLKTVNSGQQVTTN